MFRFWPSFVYVVFALLTLSLTIIPIFFFLPSRSLLSSTYSCIWMLLAMLFFRKSAFLLVSLRCSWMFWLWSAIIKFLLRFDLMSLLMSLMSFPVLVNFACSFPNLSSASGEHSGSGISKGLINIYIFPNYLLCFAGSSFMLSSTIFCLSNTFK